MDEDGLPIVGSGVDLRKVPAIQQRRLVAFLNQFIVHTVRFLNRFSTVCEEKLATISLRIQQIETTLSILETKLSSIPGLEDVTIHRVDQRPSPETNGPAAGSTASPAPAASSPPSEVPGQGQEGSQGHKGEPAGDNLMTVAKDPRYARYLKMVQVLKSNTNKSPPTSECRQQKHPLVPSRQSKPHIRRHVTHNVFVPRSSPDAPVPDCSQKVPKEQDDDSSGSESSFSD
ncbi:WASH complex subunit 3 [Silurus meridionalis]|nr:WASH complex subunit 3 [Silurus meridionalis]